MDLMTVLGACCGIGVILFVLSSGGMLRFLLNWEGAARALVVQADAERPFPFALDHEIDGRIP